MPDCTTCIMEPRIHYIETKLDEQAGKFADSQTEIATKMTRMEGKLDQLFNESQSTNKMVSDVLRDRQQDEIEKARSTNGPAAKKWNSLSAETKSVIKGIFLLIVGAAITLFFKRFY